MAPWVQATLEPALRVASSPQHAQPSLGPVLPPLVSCQIAGCPGPMHSYARATDCFTQQLQTPWRWRLVDLRVAGPGGAVPRLGARAVGTPGAVGGVLLQGGLQGDCDRGLLGGQAVLDWKRGQPFFFLSPQVLSCLSLSIWTMGLDQNCSNSHLGPLGELQCMRVGRSGIGVLWPSPP